MITGNNNIRGFFRIKRDGDNKLIILKDDEYNKSYTSTLNVENQKFVKKFDCIDFDFILNDYSNIKIDVYRETKKEDFGTNIFYIDLNLTLM